MLKSHECVEPGLYFSRLLAPMSLRAPAKSHAGLAECAVRCVYSPASKRLMMREIANAGILIR